MATVAIRCPGCGANDPSTPDDHGIHTCAFCSTRYKMSGQVATRMPAPEPEPPVLPGGTTLWVIGGVVITVMTAIGVASAVVAVQPKEPEYTLPDAPAITWVEPSTTSSDVAPPEEPAATFTMHSTRMSLGTTFYVYGEIENTTRTVTLDKVEVVVVLKDEAGDEVGTDHGYAVRDVVPPGGRTPISILVSDPPPFASMEFEVVPKKATWTPTQVEGLRVEAGPLVQDRSFWKATGKVFNEGSVDARFVEIEIVGRDAEGLIVGVDTTYAKGDVLKAGSSARFDTSMVSFARTPTKVEYAVSGRPAE
ncbi:MAG: hypothetical protein H6739_26350 [Alphaproteobacteria bacterium]|nr:hypothetical protein [Alphaproteobacteria bacterium]